MRVLVTGGCGFIGQEVVSQLVLDGHQVTVLDKKTKAATGWRTLNYNPKVRLIRGDVCDSDAVSSAMLGIGPPSSMPKRSDRLALPDLVIHMAA